MTVNPIPADTTSGTTGSSTSSNSFLDSSNMFITLLTAELKAQDPTAPLDPNEMVQQVVSLNQLQQLMQINQTLQSLTTPANTTTPPTNS
ncbi:MAG TPA: flagellar hook capping FlgD N-terminal domain-containing protein [Terriglobales bacterium]|nr:flagellar hook capping FlgD N-terminal domain-containing protein [Terriglobales bacterium]